MFDYTKTIINAVKAFFETELGKVRTRLEKLVSAAQNTAESAQNTADTAKAIAAEVKTQNNAFKKAFLNTWVFNFKKSHISTADSFVVSGTTYVKVSDFNAKSKCVVSSKSINFTGTEVTYSKETVVHGCKCGRFLIVNDASYIVIDSGVYYPPSPGVYAQYVEGNDTETAGILTIDVVEKEDVATKQSIGGVIVGDGLDVSDDGLLSATNVIVSSTTGSTKRFRITVDDSGTLSATEVTS